MNMMMKHGEDDLSDQNVEPSSLEYIEDSYLPKIDNNCTPSLDEPEEFDYEGIDENFDDHWTQEADMYLRSLTIDKIISIPDNIIDEHEMQMVETEFASCDSTQNTTMGSKRLNYLLNSKTLKFLTKKKMREVRVTFVDFSKPYLAKISSGDNYRSFLNIGSEPGELRNNNTHTAIVKI